MENLTYALLTVPLILIVSIAIVSQFTASTQSNFENSITEAQANLTGVCPCSATYTTVYPAKDNSLVVTMKNVSGGTAYTGTDVNTTQTYDQGKAALAFTVTSRYNGTVSAAYTGYSAQGYSTFQKTENGTWNGFNLASMLPFIVIAVTIVGIILGAFVIKGSM